MKIDFTPDPSLYPFKSRWFDSSSGQMHYIDQGTGAPILLCHGNPTWSFLYRHPMRRLSDRSRCVAMDYLGFGLSERPENYGYTIEEHARSVGELVDHLGLKCQRCSEFDAPAPRLGHSTPAFTLQVYSYVLPGMQEEAARVLEARLLGLPPSSR